MVLALLLLFIGAFIIAQWFSGEEFWSKYEVWVYYETVWFIGVICGVLLKLLM